MRHLHFFFECGLPGQGQPLPLSPDRLSQNRWAGALEKEEDWSWPVRRSPMSLTGRFWEEVDLERVRPEGKLASPEPQFSHLSNGASDSVASTVLHLIYMALQ